jgi:adenylate cyclase
MDDQSSTQGILFIDDEEGVRRSVQRALKREPYNIYTAVDGQRGIDFVRDHVENIATVVSDFKMPGLDGLETLKIIGGINPEITRIILTGYATMEAAIDATNSGIDGFLTKPFDNVELRVKIRDIWIRKHLRQFVCEQIYEELHKSPMSLIPRFQDVTILFSDIRNFTAMSQHVSPEALVNFLNSAYFAPMGDIAYQHQGTLDKHIGDSIMVVFGSPVARQDDARRAVQAAIAMQRRAKDIDRQLEHHPHLRLRTGIGIASGKVFSGIMGSSRKKEFTCVGLAVNIAARLQGLAGGGEILVDAPTAAQLELENEMEALTDVSVKGLDEPIHVYRIRA